MNSAYIILMFLWLALYFMSVFIEHSTNTGYLAMAGVLYALGQIDNMKNRLK